MSAGRTKRRRLGVSGGASVRSRAVVRENYITRLCLLVHQLPLHLMVCIFRWTADPVILEFHLDSNDSPLSLELSIPAIEDRFTISWDSRVERFNGVPLKLLRFLYGYFERDVTRTSFLLRRSFQLRFYDARPQESLISCGLFLPKCRELDLVLLDSVVTSDGSSLVRTSVLSLGADVVPCGQFLEQFTGFSTLRVHPLSLPSAVGSLPAEHLTDVRVLEIWRDWNSAGDSTGDATALRRFLDTMVQLERLKLHCVPRCDRLRRLKILEVNSISHDLLLMLDTVRVLTVGFRTAAIWLHLRGLLQNKRIHTLTLRFDSAVSGVDELEAVESSSLSCLSFEFISGEDELPTVDQTLMIMLLFQKCSHIVHFRFDHLEPGFPFDQIPVAFPQLCSFSGRADPRHLSICFRRFCRQVESVELHVRGLARVEALVDLATSVVCRTPVLASGLVKSLQRLCPFDRRRVQRVRLGFLPPGSLFELGEDVETEVTNLFLRCSLKLLTIEEARIWNRWLTLEKWNETDVHGGQRETEVGPQFDDDAAFMIGEDPMEEEVEGRRHGELQRDEDGD